MKLNTPASKGRVPTKVARLATILGLLAAMILLPGSARAGSNGQQLKVQTGDMFTGMVTLSLDGYNQSGTHSTYSTSWWSCTWPSCPTSHTVQGMWWVGQVTVNVRLRTSPFSTYTKTCYANVPRSMNGDVFTVTCR